MNILKASLDTRHENSVIGMVTQFDHATLELQVLTDGVIDEAWDNPRFELIAMKRDMNSVREVDQDKFTILSKEEHRVQIELKEQFLTCRGTVKMQLVVKDGSRLSTTLFYLVIGQSLDHDIVESHRDVAVLDELEAYIKQGFDDLAYQEQRMAAVEQSTNDLNDTMNANEAERNAAETKRSQMFETNETNRTQTFNNQIEEQSIAFSNAQTQREKDFSESQQNISQEFETSQKERESDFNELQKSNQKTFETNEQKRQMTFSQSQGANKQTFTQNETDRQRIFESNESDRQESESQRVQNELERVKAETQRAEAEVTRQQKMTDFEEKATQLSEDLDSQVARVDEFVAANEEKLLGPHDKTDYMGNAHKSVKDANDANVEYILGEVNTVNYEGQHITATDTIEKQVRSAILKGQTLVNLENTVFPKTTGWYDNSGANSFYKNVEIVNRMKPNTDYLIYVEADSTVSQFLSVSGGLFGAKAINLTNGQAIAKVSTPSELPSQATHYFKSSVGGSLTTEEKESIKLMIIEYQDGMENWDVSYFEGMKSVKMPVLTTTGENLFYNTLEYGDFNNSTGIPNNTSSSIIRTKEYNEISSNGTYRITVFNETATSTAFYVHEYDNDFNYIKSTNSNIFTTSANTKYVKFRFRKSDSATYTEEELSALSCMITKENTIPTTYKPYKSNILSTPEDVVLRSIGDFKDELNCLTGELTKRVGEIVLDGSEDWQIREFNATNTECAIFTININDKLNSWHFNCDKFKHNNVDIIKANNIEGTYSGGKPYSFFINVSKTKASTVEEFKNWLSNNNVTVQYCCQESIKTVDLNGQKVYSYDGTTHYSCSAAEGSLIPTLAIDVPTNLPALVSRQRATIESQKEQIITLEQENEQLIAQNEVQDIDISLNQDAINFMLFAPATMSVNNKSRNNEGVNIMAAYLANQILKGKLDYALVVGRYGSYKEDIDTILIAEGKQDLIK